MEEINEDIPKEITAQENLMPRFVPAAISFDEIRMEQQNKYPEYFEAILYNKFPTDKPELKNKIKNFIIQNNALYYNASETVPIQRLVIPYRLREAMMYEFHVHPLQGAHLGTGETFKKMATRIYWPGMLTDIKNYIKKLRHLSESQDNAK